MKKAPSNIKSWMTAITFAEAGEWQTAQEMIPDSGSNKEISWLEKIFMAVSFAEAGLPEEALRITAKLQPPTENFMTTIGLGGVRMTYGVLVLESLR